MPGLSATVTLAAAAALCLASSQAIADQLPNGCPTGAPPGLLRAIAAVESGNAPLVVHDNPPYEAVYHPPTVEAAAALARSLIELGHAPDLGPLQINSRNLAALGLSVEDAFDRCKAERAAVRLLEPALLAALSAYNTGSPTRGVENGYVAKVLAAWFGPHAVESKRLPSGSSAPSLDPPPDTIVAFTSPERTP